MLVVDGYIGDRILNIMLSVRGKDHCDSPWARLIYHTLARSWFTGCLEKSLPEKSWIKSAVLCVLISFLLEFISRLGEVSGEGFSQIDSLYQLWWDFKEMCKKKRQTSEVPEVVQCAAALIGGDLGDSLAIAILNSITVSGSRTCVRFALT